MAFKIIFRRNQQQNHFRDWMIQALNFPKADTAVICSGFFQENFRGSMFALTQDRRFMAAAATKEIITIGIHNNTWMPAYRDFRNNFSAFNPNITSYVSSRMKWHAKVFIVQSKGIPCFAMIGSSNMTRNAFGSPTLARDFNYEADVIIWNSADSAVEKYFNQSFAEKTTADANIASEISLLYRPEDNFGRTELDRLLEIQDTLAEYLGDMRILE